MTVLHTVEVQSGVPRNQKLAVRVARAAVLLVAVAAMSGCAMLRSVFGGPTAPESREVIAQAEAQGEARPESGAIAPQALPPTVAPAAPARSTDPADVGAPAGVNVVPAASEMTPPSPLPRQGGMAETGSGSKAVGASASANVVPQQAGYYINVGLFAVPTNASNAVAILRGASLPVFHEAVESKTMGMLTRVRVGPYAKKDQAQAAAKKIKDLKLDAVVFHRK